MMLLAQISDIAPDWLRNMAIFVACGSATAYYIKGLFVPTKQRREVSFSEAPATEKRVEKLELHTTKRHAEIFASIERSEKEIRRELDERFKELNEERRHTLERLTTEFVFIRENIAAINRELKIRHEQD